jgi:hypothetical protein
VTKPRAASEAELGARILAGWERMSRAVPDGPRHNRRLAAHFRIPLVDVEHLRDIRNRVAHPGGKIRRRDLERAASVVRRAGRRTGGPARGRPRRNTRPKNAPRRTRPQWLVALLVVAAAVVLWWVLFVL